MSSEYDRFCEIYDSGNIEHVGYSVTEKKMTIKFRNGSVYSYTEVDPQYFAALVSAESCGKTFSAMRPMLSSYTRVS